MKNKAIKKMIPKRKAPRAATRFSDVSTISTAPVSIGNSIRGSKPVVTNSANGCRVVGRDFAFECKATVAAANNWSLIGGMPLTPAVLNTSSLRSYTQLFSNFKINRLVAHYITSSPTSQAGDILFYYERDRNGPMIDNTNNSFLPFVLSDPSTIIGPQWQNHSMLADPIKDWKSTNYGMNTDLNGESSGSIFLFSKTSSANSPGYILIDFDITFKEMCVNPRAGVLPISRGQWNYLTFGLTATASVIKGQPFLPVVQGINPDGTNSSRPNGGSVGDVYKVIVQSTNSTVTGTNASWTAGVTLSNLIEFDNNGITGALTLDDGYTLYTVDPGTTNGWSFWLSLEGAKTLSATTDLDYGVTVNPATFNLCCLVSLVGSINSNVQSAY